MNLGSQKKVRKLNML